MQAHTWVLVHIISMVKINSINFVFYTRAISNFDFSDIVLKNIGYYKLWLSKKDYDKLTINNVASRYGASSNAKLNDEVDIAIDYE